MFISISLSLDSFAFANPRDFRELRALFPKAEYGGERILSVEARIDDPDYKEFIRKLHGLGFRPWSDVSRHRLDDEYRYNLSLTFERSDYEPAPVLWLGPTHDLSDLVSERDGITVLTVSSLSLEEISEERQDAFFDDPLYIAGVPEPTIIVKNSLKRRLEKAGMRGVRFSDAVQIEGDCADRVKERVWLLQTDLVLPPMDPSTKFSDRSGKSYTGNFDNGFRIAELEQFAYSREALRQFGDFGLAMTHERFGHTRFNCTYLMASQQMYRFLSGLHCDICWTPGRYADVAMQAVLPANHIGPSCG